jgi:hypothetical protein
MLKKSPFSPTHVPARRNAPFSKLVLDPLRGSTYGKKYACASSLAAASLEGLFEHPVG